MRYRIIIPLLFSTVLLLCGAGDQPKAPKNAAELGKLLFFDPILSGDRTLSCASCHKPDFAFADTLALSLGTDQQKTARNTPSAMNLKGHEPLFYDGRAQTLEIQALVPIENPVEMDLPIDSALARLNRHPQYAAYFKKVFRKPATKENLGAALAAFERTLSTSDTPFDRFMKGDSAALSESAKRGRIVFNEKGKCFDCHKGPDFTNDEFRNIGLFNDNDFSDRGRAEITKDSADLGKFRVPGLRNVAVTAPYMHNGMFKTLREVIDYYDTPQKFVKAPIGTDTLIVPLRLSEQEKLDLEAFMEALTDERFRKTR